MTEYIVDFGDERSSAFVRLAMAQAEASGARLQEEIVRCRDCKHYHATYNSCDEFGDIWHDEYSTVEPDGFCKWASRKEVDE